MTIRCDLRMQMLAGLAMLAVTAHGSRQPTADTTAASSHVRSLAASCGACHGTDGRAVQGEAMVTLAGYPKEALIAQMQAFRDGSRPSTVMRQIAKGYTDQQIDALATYFADVPSKRP